MKKLNVLVIAASINGYGHLYRGEMICNYLQSSGMNVTYISNARIATCGNFNYISFKDFSIKVEDGSLVRNVNSFFNSLRLKQRIKSIEKVNGKFDFVIFENFPLGKLFLVKEFMLLKESTNENCKFVCLFRDIYNIKDYKYLEKSAAILNKKFCMLLICSDENILQLPDNVISKLKLDIRYIGYLDENSSKDILIFGGGGKYNMEFYSRTLKIISELPALKKNNVTLFTGHLLPNDDYEILIRKYPKYKISRHCDSLYEKIVFSYLTISTFGYNTFVQLLRSGSPNIIVPLRKNKHEQIKRATKFMTIKPDSHLIELQKDYEIKLRTTLNIIVEKKIKSDGLDELVTALNNKK